MKNLLILLCCTGIWAGFPSCKKNTFIQSKDALLTTSIDTLHYDTVFTTIGSVTQSFKIFNLNDKKLRISSVQLMGGNASAFKMNVDGTPGATFTNIDLQPNDSIYVFISVTINPATGNLPFVVRDSILINHNGNQRYVQLDAFGQNANFYRNRRITRDSTWNNQLPFVILDGLSVDENVTLTINKGTKIYCHANAPFIVNGSLKVLGEKFDSTRVTFSGDRTDPVYRDFPGSWPGIYFTEKSKNNLLEYAIIKNAYQGIITTLPAPNNQTKLVLNQCILDNIFDAGILSLNSSIKAVNCLVSNCGNNVAIGSGGNYEFVHCTLVGIGNNYVQHKNPVLYITNANGQGAPLNLSASFTNCIFYGEGGIAEDEIVLDRKTGSNFSATFTNSLYKVKTDPVAGVFVNSIKNQSPQFDSLDAGNRFFNFRLLPASPAVNKGLPTSLTIDLDGRQRPAGTAPDMGCYEQ